MDTTGVNGLINELQSSVILMPNSPERFLMRFIALIEGYYEVRLITPGIPSH